MSCCSSAGGRTRLRTCAMQTYHLRFQATQDPNCEVTLEVLNKTSSGEHKFKVGGNMLTCRDGKWNATTGRISVPTRVLPYGRLQITL
jgi:hypothetical protein